MTQKCICQHTLTHAHSCYAVTFCDFQSIRQVADRPLPLLGFFLHPNFNLPLQAILLSVLRRHNLQIFFSSYCKCLGNLPILCLPQTLLCDSAHLTESWSWFKSMPMKNCESAL